MENLLESLLKQTYPKNYFDIYVSCDNCQDKTAKIAKSYNINVLEKHDNAHLGKTGNVQWALRKFLWKNMMLWRCLMLIT